MTSDIRRFIGQYILATLFGTVVIALSAPLVDRASLPPAFDALDCRLQALPGVPAASAFVRKYLGWDIRQMIPHPSPSPRQPTPEVPLPQLPAPAPRPAPPAPAKPKPIAGEERPGHWAVVRHPRTPVYNEKGKFLTRLAPGVLADVKEIRMTKSGDLALCRVPGERAVRGDVLISAADLDVQRGPLEAADKQVVDLRVGRAHLTVELAEMKQQAAGTLRTDNPYAAEYAATQKAYNTYWSKARDLQAKRDAATGDKREKFADELRGMKGEDFVVGQAMEGAKKKYDAWNAAHPRSPSASPEMRQIETNLANINTELKRISDERRAREVEEP
jgi:hypothetical protein